MGGLSGDFLGSFSFNTFDAQCCPETETAINNISATLTYAEDMRRWTEPQRGGIRGNPTTHHKAPSSENARSALCRRPGPGPGAPCCPVRSVSSPVALCVRAWCSGALPALSVSGSGAFSVGPGALCVGARRSLCRFALDPGFKFDPRRILGPDLGFKFGSRRALVPDLGFKLGSRRALGPDLGLQFGPRRALRPDLAFKFGPKRAVGLDLGFKFGPRRALGPDLGFKFDPRRALRPDLGFKFGPRRTLGPDLGFKFGPRRALGLDLQAWVTFGCAESIINQFPRLAKIIWPLSGTPQ